MKWKNIASPNGYYESRVFDISSPLTKYISNIEVSVINIHEQLVVFEYSTSRDSTVWSEWRPFDSFSHNLFENQKLDKLLFKYRVSFKSNDPVKNPYFQSIKIILNACISIDNIGDLPTDTKIWITKTIDDGDVSLVNNTSNKTLLLKGLKKDEVVFMDSEHEEIISSLPLTYRYDNHNDTYLKLAYGENLISGVGNFSVDIKFQHRLLHE